jgi:hypothetical protein
MQIHIKDSEGFTHKWTVYDETELTYKIQYQDLITEIHKSKCFDHFGTLHSYETKDIKFNNGNQAHSAFTTFKID